MKKSLLASALAAVLVVSCGTQNAKVSELEAQKAMKVLKETEKINRDLASSEKKLHKLEKEIAKVQGRLDQLNQQVKIVDKNTAEAENN